MEVPLGSLADKNWFSPRAAALVCGFLAVVLGLCLAAQPRVSPVFKAVENRDQGLLAQALKSPGAEIDGSYFGRTPLHLCAINDQPRLAAMLLEAGADVDGLDQYGNTPLHLAAFCHRNKMTGLLLAAGAAVDALNDQGQTPLHVAAFVKAPKDVFIWLLDHGADPDRTDGRGRSALQIARERHPAAVALLAEASASRRNAGTAGQ